MLPELAKADAELVAAIERAREAASGLDYRAGALITGADPAREVEQVVRFRREWLKRVAALAEGDVEGANRLIASAQEYVRLADRIAGLTSSVTLSKAVAYTAQETAKDIGEAASVTKRILPWAVGAIVLLLAVALFMRVKGN
jgi:hypothetical protein